MATSNDFSPPHAVATSGRLRVGTTAFDRRLRRHGQVMDVDFPPGDERQQHRVWLRPIGGGREWNPLVEDIRSTEVAQPLPARDPEPVR
ncbi:hypothetical protein [Streptomyces aidingensis]|uniref:Uncharacterized protein n=1 Tax=Streptomyces aidingensis TaxID=910347 RepID=A0A1I1RJ22_9ACTN|nr:hypothetical protein [Streptomyces aidingensis]SFD34314.1 hypothetical protein SAMN05421773_113129 [Streptomyces aidingensis]